MRKCWKKVEQTETMNSPVKRQRWWLLILMGASIPVTVVLGNLFNIPQRITALIIVAAALGFGATSVWMRANAIATGEEWWQDDSASGWRGY